MSWAPGCTAARSVQRWRRPSPCPARLRSGRRRYRPGGARSGQHPGARSSRRTHSCVGEPRGTPTRVGRTHDGCAASASPRRHPHAGGEDVCSLSSRPHTQEAPPRGWGGRHRANGRRAAGGGTPTRVGRTRQADRAACALGEAPPRGWGGPGRTAPPAAPSRGTPTRVGRTSRAHRSPFASGRHPHAGGEDHANHEFCACITEAPPRGWGGPSTVSVHDTKRGGTPTRVGRTREAESDQPADRRHPHAGGEDPQPVVLDDRREEAPPRGWGGRAALMSFMS